MKREDINLHTKVVVTNARGSHSLGFDVHNISPTGHTITVRHRITGHERKFTWHKGREEYLSRKDYPTQSDWARCLLQPVTPRINEDIRQADALATFRDAYHKLEQHTRQQCKAHPSDVRDHLVELRNLVDSALALHPATERRGV